MTEAKSEYNAKIFWALLIVAFITRLCGLSLLPMGLNQDEAFSGYEAFSLLHGGTDSWLHRFPIYFTSWGSGANVLYSYLTVPFMALLGPEIWVMRLPQAILGFMSCYIFYLTLKRIYNLNTALIGLFFITASPWHIMLSRWGLEANVAVFFLLTGFYFFTRATENSKYLYLSAVFYGLGLYTYALCAPFITIVFALQLLYWLCQKFNRHTLLCVIISGTVFMLFAIPLILLVLVNNDIIPAIHTPYFSIPKLVYWRSGEIGFNDFALKLDALKRVLIFGDDYLITNRLKPFGIFYPFSIILVGVGLILLIKQSVKDIRQHRFSFSACITLQIILGMIYATLLYPCINRLNFLWLNLLIALVITITVLPKKICALALAAYTIGFILFAHTYITSYNHTAAENFTPDFSKALTTAEDIHRQTNLPIVILEQPTNFPKVLFLSKISNLEFQQTVQWRNYPASYLEARSFSHYIFLSDFNYANIPTDAIYIAPQKHRYYFYQFTVIPKGALIVAVPQSPVM